jgi:hypothetical protein
MVTMIDETKEEVEQQEPCKLMPVVEMRDLPGNLEACTKDPNSLEPEAFAQLEHMYSKALNQAKCPCESEDVFADCCRAFWRLAKSAWEQREDAEKKIRREAHKAELDATAKDKKDAAKATEICRVLIMPDGLLAVQVANDKIPLSQVAGALAEAHDKVMLQLAAQQTMKILQTIGQQQQAQAGSNALEM